jgi:hypothetical protein
LRKFLRLVVIGIPALTLLSGIALMGVVGEYKISSRQFDMGFAYYAGLHPSFRRTPFVVELRYLSRGESELVECADINCPISEMEEITRRHFGSSLALQEAMDGNGQLTDQFVNQAASWKMEMNLAVFRNIPASYMEYVPVNVWFDHRGQPELAILIWLTISGAVGSAVVIPLGLVAKARSYNNGEGPDVEGRDSAQVTTIGSFLK